jgi:hypothetical protein
MQRSGVTNGPEERTGTDWDASDWRKADRLVRNLRHRIFRASQAVACEVSDPFEPYEAKVSSTVPGGGRGGDAPPLPGSTDASNNL